MIFQYPVSNCSIIKDFEEHERIKIESDCPYYNGGIDFLIVEGTNVHSCCSGSVLAVAMDAHGYGNYIKINHEEGYQSLYAHLEKILVSEGDYVEAGFVIGTGGNSGDSSCPHLHFEIRYSGVPVDPFLLLNNKRSGRNHSSFKVGDEVLISPGVVANLRDANRNILGVIYPGVEVVVSGSSFVMNGLVYYPVTICGYIVSVDSFGHFILEKNRRGL